MSDTPFTEAERRLADALAHHAAVATDPRSTRTVAAEAMRLGRRRSWAWRWPRTRLLAFSAALLLPLAGVLAAATILPNQDAATGAQAMVARSVGDGIDIVAIDMEGRERLVRHLVPDDLGLGPRYQLMSASSVRPSGWLRVDFRAPRDGYFLDGRAVYLDLADPTQPQVVVPSMGTWDARGPRDQVALICRESTCYGATTQSPRAVVGQTSFLEGSATVLVIDLATGSKTIVDGVTLHNRTPEVIWTADGSGFLAGDIHGWGVTPLDGGPDVPGTPRIHSRRSRLEPTRVGSPISQLVAVGTLGRRWLSDTLAPAVLVDALNSADGDAIWMLLDETHDGRHQAVLAKLIGPGAIESTVRFDVPGPVGGFELSEDDATAVIYLGEEEDGYDSFVVVPMREGASPSAAVPLSDTAIVLGLVPATAATWPGE